MRSSGTANVPRISFSATCVIERSRIAMNAADMATMATHTRDPPSSPVARPASLAAFTLPFFLFLDVHGDVSAHAGAKLRARGVVELDEDRDALHDLDEVAGRVVGRQEREACSRRAGDAVDFPGEVLARIGVDRELHRLTGVHLGQLVFFEV